MDRQARVIRETVGGEPYDYRPLGQYVVAAPGVCGGRPTFKYTRLEAAVVLDLLAAGWAVEEIIRQYANSRLTKASIAEAIRLARLGPSRIDYYSVDDP